MSNAGLKLREPAYREPVIGDELDQMTYGRPSGQTTKTSEPRRVAARPAAAKRARRNQAPAAARPAAVAASAAPVYDSGRTRIDEDGVRTVKIRGQATPARRRAQSMYERPIARYDQHPDRAAQWALFLGVFMVVVAIVTGT